MCGGQVAITVQWSGGEDAGAGPPSEVGRAWWRAVVGLRLTGERRRGGLASSGGRGGGIGEGGGGEPARRGGQQAGARRRGVGAAAWFAASVAAPSAGEGEPGQAAEV